VDRAHRQSLARPAGDVRQLEHSLSALPLLGRARCVQSDFRRSVGRSRPRIRHGRRHHRSCPPPRARRKRGTQSQAIGKSKGGWTTKILALTDALGNLVRFQLLPGQRYDTVGVAPLIQDIEFGGLIADKAFDSNWIIEELNQRGAKIIISQRPRRIMPLEIDTDLYKWRHLIENFFCKLKEFKRIAMRVEKTDASYAAMICAAAAMIHSR
jgi:transposase